MQCSTMSLHAHLTANACPRSVGSEAVLCQPSMALCRGAGQAQLKAAVEAGSQEVVSGQRELKKGHEDLRSSMRRRQQELAAGQEHLLSQARAGAAGLRCPWDPGLSILLAPAVGTPVGPGWPLGCGGP
jgi:hypothetical protein